MLAPINGRYRGPALVKESTRDEEPGGKSYAGILAARAIEGCFYLSPLLSIAAVYVKKEYPHRIVSKAAIPGVALEGRFFTMIDRLGRSSFAFALFPFLCSGAGHLWRSFTAHRCGTLVHSFILWWTFRVS